MIFFSFDWIDTQMGRYPRRTLKQWLIDLWRWFAGIPDGR